MESLYYRKLPAPRTAKGPISKQQRKYSILLSSHLYRVFTCTVPSRSPNVLMVLLDISQALRKREASEEGFALMITVEHQSSQLEAEQDAQAELLYPLMPWQLSLHPPLCKGPVLQSSITPELSSEHKNSPRSRELLQPCASSSELWPFPLLSVSAAWGGQEGLGTRVQSKKGKAGRRKQETRRDNDRGGKRTKETAQCRRNAWRTLCHPSSHAALSEMPCSAPITCRGGGKRGKEGKGQTGPPGDEILGYYLLKHNETTREAHSVKTPLNQIAQ